MTYKLWNRQDSINGIEASHFLNNKPFKDYTGDIILIYDEDKISNIECKDILAEIFEIDATLDLDSFMEIYFDKIKPEEVENGEDGNTSEYTEN